MKKFIIGYYRKCDFLSMTGVCFAFTGIILALKLHFLYATLSLILCGICDAFDGRLARKYKYEKNAQVYGVQLDSLADVICFGAFPAILTCVQSQYILTYIISAFYLLCGVIRLAYFNTMAADENAEKNVYIGVPITMASIIYPAVLLITRFINKNAVFIVMPCILLILGVLFIIRIRIKKPDILKILKKIFNIYTVNFLFFPLFILFFSDIYFKLNFPENPIKSAFNSIVNHFPAFILLFLAVSAFFLILISIFNNSKKAKITSAIITVLLLTINDIKYSIMGIPLQFSDVNYLNPDNITMIGTATTTIGSWIIKVIIKSLVLLAFFLVFIIFDRNGQTFKFKTVKIRLLSVASSLIIIALPVVLGIFGSPVILWFYGITQDQCSALPEAEKLYYDYGYYQGLYINGVSSNYVKPENYDRDEIDNVISNISDSATKNNWGKANVVFILSEAFSDIQNIDEINFTKSITPNIDSYAKDNNKLVFDLLVPALGGTSVNTEFEILTGSSLSLWPSNFIPYTSYYKESNGPYAPNIIKEFNNNGYQTMYLTPWGRDSYKSEYVYSLFGADKKIYGDSLKGEPKGYYYSDDSLMDDIFNQLKDTSVGNYKFIMAATGENHFPYESDRFPITDVVANSDALNEEQIGMLTSYAQGIYDADKALDKLYQNIKTLDIPTIIVFYGDHLPHIVDSKGNKPYLDSEYFNTDNENLNLYRAYTTKGVILANFDLDTTDSLDYINASYLGSYVLNKMDLEISDYFKFIDYSRTILPLYNRESVYLNNSFISPIQLSEPEKTVLENLKNAKYRWFYDFMDK